VIEAVVFDLDGTLLWLPIDYEALFEEFKRIMRVNEVRPLVDAVSGANGKTRELVFKAWDKAEKAVSGRVTVNEAGMETYRKFVSKPKALVTLRGKAIAKAILKQFNLTFDFVVTREDALFRVAQLTKAISLLGFEPKNVLFIGNTEGDTAAAEKVGCQFLRIK
jgi:phosphoglycolate phosphatase-like HAD superfamily hydrolase